MKTKHLVLISFLFVLVSCGSEKVKKNEAEKTPDTQTQVTPVPQSAPEPDTEEERPGFTVITGDSKVLLEKYYKLPHISSWYEEELKYGNQQAPDLEVPDDLDRLSYEQLRLLRNEVFAKNGYLFNDGFLRGYFNKYKWYKPIFDVDSFKIVLNDRERKLVSDLIREEKKRKEEAYAEKQGLELFNADLIANKNQFSAVNKEIMNDLRENNFSLVGANRAMPFYIYDKNAYNYIPHYITTDLYLFILHKYFGRFLEKLDENYLSKHLGEMISHVQSDLSTAEYADETTTEALNWARTYMSLSHFALTGERDDVSSIMKAAYNQETRNIENMQGAPSLIPNKKVGYAELQPRGHYTKTGKLTRYFKAFKWISLNGADIAKPDELRGMIALAYFIKTSEKAMVSYQAFTRVLQKIAGQEDNVSVNDLLKLLDESKPLPELLSQPSLRQIEDNLQSLNKEKVKAVLGPGFPGSKTENPRLYFLSSTYSISAEVFSRLVHINGNDSKRPFPKALDVPAVFNNKTAEKIIMDEYDDDQRWPDYTNRLTTLQTQFIDFDQWEHNYAFKGLKTALASTAERDNYPDFMKTDAYNRKELSTMLSSWTHIKHDLILYQEKPYAAEAGQGGGPPAPNHYSYVEPNLDFWQESLSLVDWLMEFQSYDASMRSSLLRIKAIGEDILMVAQKQISGEEISAKEYDRLHRIGGRIEHTLLAILETDHIPERESHMALVADVYSYNGRNLNVGVGSADDIYVVVPIKGEYYIARGASFSFYEFKSDDMNTDEQWRKRARQRNLPSRPQWLAPLIHDDMMPLEGDVQFRYPGWSMLRDGM